MTYIITKNIILEKVKTNDNHIEALFMILSKRKNYQKISFKKLPSFKEHKSFVKNHPYRMWFLIIKDKKYVGTIYLSKMNEIGIFVIKHLEVIEPLVDFVIEKYKPLKRKKSIRSENFIINISPKDVMFNNIIKDMGAKLIQNTYLLK